VFVIFRIKTENIVLKSNEPQTFLNLEFTSRGSIIPDWNKTLENSLYILCHFSGLQSPYRESYAASVSGKRYFLRLVCCFEKKKTSLLKGDPIWFFPANGQHIRTREV